MSRVAVVAVSVLLSGASVADEANWSTVVTGPVTVKNRAVPGSAIKEVWAEGEVDAPLIDVQDTLMNVPRLKTFMPYMKDARVIQEHPEDKSVFIYTLIDLPIVGKRDYVTQVWQPQAVGPDGTGVFEAKWVARPKHLPERSGVVRLQTNDGMWLATSKAPGKTWLVHKFAVDPGGWVPAFAANLGNEKGVTDTYKNVEREAQKRMKERLAAPVQVALPGSKEADLALPRSPR